MTALFVALLTSLRITICSRLELAAEILALQHQLAVLQRNTPTRPRLRSIDRLVWVLLSSVWPNWRRAVQMVTPATVVAWHRRAFATYWSWKSRTRFSVGRPALAPDLQALIRQMRQANSLWGAPRIHGELLKLGIEVSPGQRGEVPRASGLADNAAKATNEKFLAHARQAERSAFAAPWLLSSAKTQDGLQSA